MKEPHRKLALQAGIIIIISSLLNLLILYSMVVVMLIYLIYMISAVFLTHRNIKIGWFMLMVYFSLGLMYSLFILVEIYINLIKYSDANWGGLLSFIFPLPPVILFIVGLWACLKKEVRVHFQISFQKI